VSEPTEAEYLAVLAAHAGAYVTGTADDGPITRHGWDTAHPGMPQPPVVPHEEILAQRAAILAAINVAEDGRALVPETVALIDGEGAVHYVPVDDLDDRLLLAAEIAEAACAVMLARAFNTRAARLAGLERLRRMRADLEQAEGAI